MWYSNSRGLDRLLSLRLVGCVGERRLTAFSPRMKGIISMFHLELSEEVQDTLAWVAIIAVPVALFAFGVLIGYVIWG